jgi:hypothetical protein
MGSCYNLFGGFPGKSRGPVSEKVSPLGEVIRMSKDRRRFPKRDKRTKRRRDPLLTKVDGLVSLSHLILHILEIILKLMGMVK